MGTHVSYVPLPSTSCVLWLMGIVVRITVTWESIEHAGPYVASGRCMVGFRADPFVKREIRYGVFGLFARAYGEHDESRTRRLHREP